MSQLLRTIYQAMVRSSDAWKIVEHSTPLGRWKIENELRTNRKADYANDDHSGVSLSFAIQNDNDVDEYDAMSMIDFVQDFPQEKRMQ
jgi:hypothetical protein